MKRSTRRLASLASAVAMAFTLAAGTAGADPATPTKIAAPGMRLQFEKGKCTLGAVGTDAGGRKVGITAGHCNPWEIGKGVAEATHTTTNDDGQRVWDWRDKESGPIGWIRYISADSRPTAQWPAEASGEANIQKTLPLDYMVIEFAPHIQLSSQVMTAPTYEFEADGVTPFSTDEFLPSATHGSVVTPSVPWFKINTNLTGSSGQLVAPGTFAQLCQVGSYTTQANAQAGQPQSQLNRCGTVTHELSGVSYGNIKNRAGDSGGPLVGRLEPHKWAGIVSGQGPTVLGYQYYYNSAKIILQDMNSKPDGFTGKGFQLTNN
ncbi:hypothetical protein O4215_07810 [Rhodococcus maanshanensis]|jgi:hypothetical protein|uniref:hypothetical protein n=2 Tax=Rhodococcus TaxID=1827 RepID=UPI0022B3928D|nr:hypothetical protein [Rhodococcus maanshanensis]MCZ4555479.1 hypothetical protein [Rhodococcus maanshanensis]